MEQLPDLAPVTWITEGTDSIRESDEGVHVTGCLARGFQAYCKIFHPIYIDPSVEDRSLTWHDVEEPTVIRGVPIHGVVTVRGAPPEPFSGVRTRWRELADRYGLRFHPNINAESFTRNFPGRSWPRYLVGPEEGRLDPETTARVVVVLDTFTGGQECFFYYDIIAARYESPLLYRGRLAEVLELLDLATVTDSPTYWWPSDRTWCLHTNHDLPFTLIGGSRELVEALLADDVLECAQVDAMSRVDYRADRINP